MPFDNNELTEIKAFLLGWCSHFLERIVRLRQYLSERAAAVPSGSRTPDMISKLLDRNDELGEELSQLGSRLIKESSETLGRVWTNYYTRLRIDIPKTFRNLHSYLCFIPTPWPRPEVDLFVRRILEAAGYKSDDYLGKSSPWQLLLTGEYNFSDILIHDVSYLDPRSFINVSELKPLRTPSRLSGVLTIPAVEKENPLSWPNLIHELSHSIGDSHGIVEKAKSLSSVKKFQKDTGVYNQLRVNWVPEIVSDLLATDMLGIGYYKSLVLFSTYWVEKSLRNPEISHPPVSVRQHYIFSRLRNLGIINDRFSVELDLDKEYNQRLNLDTADMAVLQNLFDRLRKEKSSGPGEASTDWAAELEQIAQEIVELDEYKSIFSSPGGPSDTHFLLRQAENLNRGWLIASKREKEIAKQEWPLEKLRSSPNLREAKHHLVECANDVRDIMVSALLRNAIIDRTVLEEFFENKENKSMRTRLIDLWAVIHNHDVIITKSFEGSEIVRFYQSHEAFHK
jgi:hypothetical protein